MIEGALSSSADYVAVIDGDLQHDETRLPVMLAALQAGGYDLAVASRHVEGGDSAGLSSRFRHVLSDGGIWLAQAFLPVRLTDPMSGFFMLPRPLFEDLARGLNGQGFKILLDLVLSSRRAAAGAGSPRPVPRTRRGREQDGRAGDGPVRRPAAGQGVRRACCRCASSPSRWSARWVSLVHLAVLGLLRDATAAGFRSRTGASRPWLRWCSTFSSTTRSPIATSG